MNSWSEKCKTHVRSIVRVQSISPRPQLDNFSRATVPLSPTIIWNKIKYFCYVELKNAKELNNFSFLEWTIYIVTGFLIYSTYSTYCTYLYSIETIETTVQFNIYLYITNDIEWQTNFNFLHAKMCRTHSVQYIYTLLVIFEMCTYTQ